METEPRRKSSTGSERLHEPILKKVGAIDNSERGVWALTSKGRAFTEKDAADVVKQVRSQFRKQGQPEIVPSEEMEVKADEAEISWKESLLSVLKSMSPAGFERLSPAGFCAKAGSRKWKFKDVPGTVVSMVLAFSA